MRNSASITSATSPDSVNNYTDNDGGIPKSISSGSCSTVTGTRPTCYLYSSDVNYELIGECVNKYLEEYKTAQTVILCDQYISPRQVKPLLTGDVTLYDAGVEQFDDYRPRFTFSADIVRQREDLVTWIHCGGVLLTHDSMFRGCEAETIVFLTKYWVGAGYGRQARSGPTRAVSQLCLVTSDYMIKPEEIKQHFTVVDVREDQAVSQSGEEEETDTD